jgi:hypothetical protein
VHDVHALNEENLAAVSPVSPKNRAVYAGKNLCIGETASTRGARRNNTEKKKRGSCARAH